MHRTVLRNSAWLLGEEMLGEDDRVIGRVGEVLIDCRSGRISHLVIQSQEHVSYLPWAAIQMCERDGAVVLKHGGRRRHPSS